MDYELHIELVRERAESVYLDGSHGTPDLILNMMVEETAPSEGDRVLVLFDPVIALRMRQLGVIDISLYMPTINDRMLPWFDQVGINVISELDPSMKKFDTALLNPPYKGKAAMHQKFFNRTIELVEDGGQVICIQPATPYINKKAKKKAAEATMIKNIETHTVDVTMYSGSDIFPGTRIQSNLAVTHLVKDYSNSGVVDYVEYTSGTAYNDLPVDSISRTEIDPKVFLSLRNKIDKYISDYGCLQDVVTDDKKEYKYSLPMIRGDVGSDNFYSFISRDKIEENGAQGNWGILVDNEKQFRNAGIYFQSYVARFCLSILKFTTNHHMGEFRGVPVVNFNYKWDDESLCELFGITKKEYKEILRVIPEYH
jgi:hypothetical protein